MSQHTSYIAEEEPLLAPGGPDTPQLVTACPTRESSDRVRFSNSPASALPLSFISALALAATAATKIYAYAAILCRDPSHCDDDERRKFAASVAIAATIGNAFALFTLSGFEALGKRNSQISLAIWLFLRSLSDGALVLGAFIGNVSIVMSSQVFEGLASDNILHFNLNALYAREVDNNKASRLIGSSLALYMIGISISPSVAGLLHNYTDSFIVSYGLFIGAFVYLFCVVKVPPLMIPIRHTDANPTPGVENRRFSLKKVVSHSLTPFYFIIQDVRSFSIGLVLFLYNTAQSYTFSAIMVHTSTQFGFSSRENGFIITLVHIVASLYLFCVLFIAPRLAKFGENGRKKDSPLRSEEGDRQPRTATNAILALASLTIQACALLWFGLMRKAWQVYLASVFLAIGLAFPSFLKSDFASRFDLAQRPRALASLSAMEMTGSFVAPITLGSIQTLWPGTRIFFAASGFAFLAGGILFTEIVSDRLRLYYARKTQKITI